MVRRVFAVVVCMLVLGWPLVARADPVSHAVDGAAVDQHVLVHLGSAACDPAGGIPNQHKDPHFFCRYTVRGTYADGSEEAYLGSGRVSGRFTFDTRSWTEESPGYGCFALFKGVVKFTTDAGGRLRTRISRSSSSICQAFDGVTVNGPDRTIRWILKVTPGGCVPPYCGVTGKLVWESTAIFDTQAPPDIVRYLDTATFRGTLTSP